MGPGAKRLPHLSGSPETIVTERSRAERATAVLDRLEEVYPDDRPLLIYDTPFQLLIAVILSAQTTDAQVNAITPLLFSRYPDACSLAAAAAADVEAIVHPAGFFRSKARNIRSAARTLCDRFGGVVPRAMDELLSLAGVGRKSANVVRGALFGLPAIIVDTHFARVNRRLGLTGETDATRLESDVGRLLPDHRHYSCSMRINYHGRDCCFARSPACSRCPIRDLCPYPDEQK